MVCHEVPKIEVEMGTGMWEVLLCNAGHIWPHLQWLSDPAGSHSWVIFTFPSQYLFTIGQSKCFRVRDLLL